MRMLNHFYKNIMKETYSPLEIKKDYLNKIQDFVEHHEPQLPYVGTIESYYGKRYFSFAYPVISVTIPKIAICGVFLSEWNSVMALFSETEGNDFLKHVSELRTKDIVEIYNKLQKLS